MKRWRVRGVIKYKTEEIFAWYVMQFEAVEIVVYDVIWGWLVYDAVVYSIMSDGV